MAIAPTKPDDMEMLLLIALGKIYSNLSVHLLIMLEMNSKALSNKLLCITSCVPRNHMERQKIIALQNIFSSRLDTLSHLLEVAESHFVDDVEFLLQRRIAPDMFPFGTQIAFTCNQPRNFALWCLGQSENNLNPDVASLVEARSHISSTKELLASINVADTKLSEIKRIELGQGLYVELLGLSYVDDFLMPNFYFHMTTVYDIMRMVGAPIGKRDFMIHLVPFVKQCDA